MANEQNLIPAKPGEVRNPKGRGKGALNLSTRIQRMLNDDDFQTTLVAKDGKRIEFKGNPADAIIKTAILKAMGGDNKWAEWLAKHGFGTKQIHELQTSPIDQILDKYGLSNTHIQEELEKQRYATTESQPVTDDTKEENVAGQTEKTES